MNSASKRAKNGYLSSTEASIYLGVSVTTIQNLWKAGKLSGFTTAGGHRRIDYESATQLKKSWGLKNSQNFNVISSNTVYISIESADALQKIEALIAARKFNLNILTFDALPTALIAFSRNIPSHFIAEIPKNSISKEKINSIVNAIDFGLNRCHTTFLTNEQLPSNRKNIEKLLIQFIDAPISAVWIDGYLSAINTISRNPS